MDNATVDACAATDQRGVARPQDGPDDNLDAACDAGAYEYADSDADGFEDAGDNCPGTANPMQSDADGDGIGNACDDDGDNDGDVDTQDNCPAVANADQANADGDTEGDACDDDDTDGPTGDPDADGDLNVNDNCGAVANPDQEDTDGDLAGDACDSDDDADEVGDGSDNCRLHGNPLQEDADGDDIGDACDADNNDGPAGDLDADGTPNSTDAFPTNPAETADTDDDATGNNADTDDDNDGVVDTRDAFPLNELESRDTDADGTGNNADTDDDNDKISDAADKCDLVREDLDGFQDGDGCKDTLVTSTASAAYAKRIAKIKGVVSTKPDTASCEVGRSVQLRKQRSGKDSKIGDPVTTAKDGSFAAPVKGMTGKLYVTVAGKTFGPNASGVVTTCAAATSPVVSVN